MSELYLLDAVNLLFRSYYAIGPMTNGRGEATNALYGFIRSVFKIIKDCTPKALVVVFDGPESSQSRKALYSQYKVHRTRMPEDLYLQLQRAQQFCQIAGFPYLAIPGVEADDVMGSIAKWARAKNITTFLCTSDKDLCQLVDDQVFVLNVHKEMMKIDRSKVKEIYGVYPEQMRDLLALMGDASDNIPGIKGVGSKTAVDLLQEFHSLDELLTQTEKLSPKKRALIESGKEDALLSRELATIHTQIEIPEDPEFYQIKALQVEKVKEFYQEMHFMSLLKDIYVLEQKENAIRQETQNYTLINEKRALEALVQRLLQEKEICMDTETTDLDPIRAELIGIGLGIQAGEAWYIPFNGQINPREALEPLFAKCAFYGHNIKYDLHVLKKVQLRPRQISFDTMIASYLLNPHKQRHNLDALSLEYFGKVKIPITDLIGKGKDSISMRAVPLEEVAIYCCEDVDYTIRLKKRFEEEIARTQLKKVLEEIELPLISVLVDMEERGIFLDQEKLEHMRADLVLQIDRLAHEIYALAGTAFNLNSHKQLSEVLFEQLGIQPTQKTTTGFSTSADALENLRESAPIIAKILDYRTLEKLRSTYVDALPKQINPSTQRIHCTFNQSVAATGRLSCQDPNLQNIPVRTAVGRRIRSAFRPQHLGWSFLSADYSQIELRLLAHFSEDPSLMRAFQAGEDIHSSTASLVFGVPLEEVTAEMRYAAKAVNFGILYGQQAFGLAKELNISLEKAKYFIETYFQRYPQVQEYLESSKEQARKTGKAYTLTGRQRPIPEIHSKNFQIRQSAERLAINTPLQGTAADLIKLAMIEIHRYIPYMILQIHDELILEVPDAELLEVETLVKKIMQGIWRLKIPLVVDISFGKNWEEC